MTARKFDIEIEQGATFKMDLTYRNTLGALVDLSLHDAYMQVRERVGAPVLCSMTVENGRIVLTSTGDIRVRIPASETSKIGVERCVYDLFLVAPAAAEVDKLLYGDAAVALSVTRL